MQHLRFIKLHIVESLRYLRQIRKSGFSVTYEAKSQSMQLFWWLFCMIQIHGSDRLQIFHGHRLAWWWLAWFKCERNWVTLVSLVCLQSLTREERGGYISTNQQLPQKDFTALTECLSIQRIVSTQPTLQSTFFSEPPSHSSSEGRHVVNN